MKTIQRILFFLSLFLIYFVIKEFLQLYTSLYLLHPYAGYGFLVLLAGLTVYFVIIPLTRIIMLKPNQPPAKDKSKVPELIEKRMQCFRRNHYLIEQSFDFSSITADEKGYNTVVKELKKEGARIRKRYVTALFYSTSLSQNGFIDAFLMLSGSINMVRELFKLYRGRVTNRDLLSIGRLVMLSTMIAGSEGVEYFITELFSKYATDGMKKLPGANIMLSSLADGMVNAALLTRISIITERYCTMLYIKKENELFPAVHVIADTTRNILSDVLQRIYRDLIVMSGKKTWGAFKNLGGSFRKMFGVDEDDEPEDTYS